MLCGLYTPDGGRLLVDGTPLTDLDIDRWRERVSGTFQDYARLETSGQHSVGAGDPARMDEAAPVARALEAADAERLPDRRPDGLASHLGRTYRDGVELSGGQWQRVATARAMMKRTPLLLLPDEPTAALDPVAEHALYERYTGAAREVRHGGGADRRDLDRADPARRVARARRAGRGHEFAAAASCFSRAASVR
ncbi:ATP-binding cassette domain-containing protein [Embleya sp. NPDC059259]|uniref:ATP-binding cassette domain-containing protein n=1 Tax=unclassified Embleya TaxID=2699296 RepID=UPI0036B983BC